MASAGAIRAGRAFVELFADDSRLVRGLRSAQAKLRGFGAGLTALGARTLTLGATLVTPFLAAGKVFADAGSDLVDMSQRTGVSVEALSALGFAAGQSGADLETLEAGLRKMQRTLVQAAGGSESAREALKRLGLSAAGLSQLSPDEQFRSIADSLAKITDPAQRTALALELFGKAGTRLLPLLAGGAGGIRALEDQARRLGLVLSREDAEAAEKFGDLLDQLVKSFGRVTTIVGSALAPILADIAERVVNTATLVAGWIRANTELVKTLFKVAAAVVVGGAALVALGFIFAAIGAFVGGAITLITAFGAALGLVGTLLGALATPAGIAVAAVAALGGAVLFYTGAGSRALAFLGERFGALRDLAVRAFAGIQKALAAGDFALAARIAWLGLRLVWRSGINFLAEQWINFKQVFLDVWNAAVFGIAKLWINATHFLANAWTIFTTSLRKGWATAQNFIAKGILRLMALFDESIDVEAASRVLDEDLAAQTGAIDSQRDRRLGERERTRREELAEIDRIAASEQRQRQARFERERAGLEAELSQARQAFADAVSQAENRSTSDAEPDSPERPPSPEDLLGRLRGIGAELPERTSVAGAFNALALRGLAAGDPARRTAQATEATATNTRRILDELKRGTAVFA
jgi:hypothetical protein